MSEAARQAVWQFWWHTYGLREALRFLVWTEVVKSGKTVALIAHRLGRRERTIWKWLLDEEFRLDLDEMSDIGTALGCEFGLVTRSHATAPEIMRFIRVKIERASFSPMG